MWSMSAAGVSTKRGRLAAGCALAMIASMCVTQTRAADVEESATGEVWSRAVSAAAATPAESPAAVPSPAAAASVAAAAAPSPSEAEAGMLSVSSSGPFTTGASGELHATTSETAEPPGNLANTPAEQTSVATSQEIPVIVGEASPPAPEATPAAPKSDDDSLTNSEDPYASEIGRYEREQQGLTATPPYHGGGSMAGILSEAVFSSPIGVQLQESRRSLSSGEEADGLLVLNVLKGSPAANAGLQAYSHTTHQVVTGVATVAAVAAASVGLPLMLALPLVSNSNFGENYDLIIGVDGARVTNYLDFQDRLHDVRPGEIIYLSIVRDGKRQQVKVFVPPTAASTW